jgi:hypothetical protein
MFSCRSSTVSTHEVLPLRILAPKPVLDGPTSDLIFMASLVINLTTTGNRGKSNHQLWPHPTTTTGGLDATFEKGPGWTLRTKDRSILPWVSSCVVSLATAFSPIQQVRTFCSQGDLTVISPPVQRTYSDLA